MSEAAKSSRTASAVAARLFVLELNAGRIHSMNTDGSDRKTIVSDCHLPDGIVVDVEAGHIYWTNMGIPNLDDGYIERADIDGKNRKTVVPRGKTHTPKQIILDKKGGKLYWCDREGMRVMRCNLDGSQLETLIEAGRGEADSRDQTRWCVGLTIDPKLGHLYWTQKVLIMPGSVASSVPISKFPPARRRRPGPTSRSSTIACRSRSISSSTSRTVFSTDRSRRPPRGNTVNRASVDNKPAEPEIVVTHLMEGIGIALDVPNDRMFVTDFAGSVYVARLDGSGERNFLFAQGNLTGIAYAEI